eukprot:1986469-Pyramimonas_sp.AAC.1
MPTLPFGNTTGQGPPRRPRPTWTVWRIAAAASQPTATPSRAALSSSGRRYAGRALEVGGGENTRVDRCADPLGQRAVKDGGVDELQPFILQRGQPLAIDPSVAGTSWRRRAAWEKSHAPPRLWPREQPGGARATKKHHAG